MINSGARNSSAIERRSRTNWRTIRSETANVRRSEKPGRCNAAGMLSVLSAGCRIPDRMLISALPGVRSDRRRHRVISLRKVEECLLEVILAGAPLQLGRAIHNQQPAEAQ